MYNIYYVYIYYIYIYEYIYYIYIYEYILFTYIIYEYAYTIYTIGTTKEALYTNVFHGGKRPPLDYDGKIVC